ncbi:MAG: hypothetical protein M5R36_24350 [Deltaproteobacteria bacterium]|nr:hypothetical protein [Deltaproteobacteria bacterium]
MPRISLAVVLVALLAGTLFAWTGCSCDETENDGDKSVTNVYVLPPVVVADDDDFFRR